MHAEPPPPASRVTQGSPAASSSASEGLADAAMARANAAGQALHDAVSSAEVSRAELRKTFMQAMEDRSRRLAAASLGVLVVCCCFFYSYRKQARARVVDELSDVAARSLGDEKMQAQAQQVTMQTLQALLGDKATVARSVEFLSAVAEHPSTRHALIGLLVEALKSEAVLQEALALTMWVLDDARAREHLVGALLNALKNADFLEGAGKFAVEWLDRPEVGPVCWEEDRSELGWDWKWDRIENGMGLEVGWDSKWDGAGSGVGLEAG